MALSICTTNYNCAHALPLHLESVFRALASLEFEYIVVDNKSRDGSRAILAEWSDDRPNVHVVSRKCTMGEGRQIAFLRSTGPWILVLDTDVVYDSILTDFVTQCVSSSFPFAIQALYGGMFPRALWDRVGGRRSLNTNEDVDMWTRLLQIGMMRWYTIPLGTNLKEPDALGSYDHLSARYSRPERVLRLLRREWDLFKTREIQKLDLQEIIRSNPIDLGLGRKTVRWPQNRVCQTRAEHLNEFLRLARQAIRTP